MRVLIVADHVFAVRERALLARLEIGLADEGTRVMYAIPQRDFDIAESQVFTHVIPYLDRGPSVMARLRTRRLIRDVQASLGGDDGAVDVVHAFGGSCWKAASEVARHFNASLVLEIWRSGLDVRARLLHTGHPSTLFTPDRAMFEAVRRDMPETQARLTQWGVHTPGEDRQILLDERNVGAVLVGSGYGARNIVMALEGLAEAARRFPSLLIFVDADMAHRAGLWPVARQMKIFDRLFLIPDLEGRRDLVLKADLLVQPDASGEHRTITLDAMANGMAVVAAADPMVEALGSCARILSEPTAEAWAEAVIGLLSDPVATRQQASIGREYVRQNRRASTHVAAVLDSYEWLTSSEALPFGGGSEV